MVNRMNDTLQKILIEKERFVAVLEIPPVESPKTAVQASIMADAKKRK